MGILDIKPVVRGESKVLLAFSGPSGTGKTLSALYVARGMVSKPSEIGFLDTENGRGSFYSDKLDGQFLYANLNPPFSPDRYGKAIKEFQDAGVKVLVIDSISHEWEGIGGCEEIANSLKPDGTERKVADWKRSKNEHRTKFMNALMYTEMHIICCVRAREKTDFKEPTKPVSLGIQPVCEKNFLFEMMASVMFSNEGKNQKWIKVPDYLKEAFGNGNDYLGQNTGKKIMDWVRLGEKEDSAVTKARGEIILVCEKGLHALKDAWKELTPEVRKKLNPEFKVHEASAIAFDEERKMSSDTNEIVTVDKEAERIFLILQDCNTLKEVSDLESTITGFEELFEKRKSELNEN
jgi:DNA polymerase III delta prime subunit